MEKVRVYYDAFGKTLTVWLGDPKDEAVCEEADDDTVFMKDASGRIIGFEKLNVSLSPDGAWLDRGGHDASCHVVITGVAVTATRAR